MKFAQARVAWKFKGCRDAIARQEYLNQVCLTTAFHYHLFVEHGTKYRGPFDLCGSLLLQPASYAAHPRLWDVPWRDVSGISTVKTHSWRLCDKLYHLRPSSSLRDECASTLSASFVGNFAQLLRISLYLRCKNLYKYIYLLQYIIPRIYPIYTFIFIPV